MLGLSPLELGVVALVIVLLFGTKRLPELGAGVGKAITKFKKAYREGTEIDVTPKPSDSSDKDKSDTGTKA